MIVSLNAVQETLPWLADHRWVFGLVMAVLTGLVIIGGIKRIALTAEKIVPAMCGSYLLTCLVVLLKHTQKFPLRLGRSSTAPSTRERPGAASSACW